MKTKTKFGRKLTAYLINHKSQILTGVGLVGFGTSLVLMAKAQKTADDILAERDAECKENYTPSKKEILDLTWQCYIPVAITSLVSVGCIVGGSYISAKEIAALTGSVAFLTANRDQLEKAIKDKYGEDALAAIKNSLEVRNPEPEVIITCAEPTGHGDLLCCEAYAGRWFRASEEWVKKCEEAFSEDFSTGNWQSLNDFYDMLGISETHFGHQFGWPADEMYYDLEKGIEFVNTRVFDEKRGEEVLYIDIYTWPIECWYEY